MAQPPADAEDRKDAKQRSCQRAHADQRIHIRRTLKQRPRPHDIEAAVQIHDWQHEQHL